MKKILLPENLNNFVAMLQNFWGEYSFDKTEFIIGVDEDLEVRLEVEGVFMEKTCIQSIIAGHSLNQRSVEGDLLLRL